MSQISLLTSLAPPSKTAEPPGAAPEGGAASPFQALLAETLSDATVAGRAGESAALDALVGRASLQDVVQAVNAAEVTLETVVAVRDRMIAAYQEIMRMPI